MTLLEKIIYIADYIEPNREMDCHPFSLDEIRHEAYQDIDHALLMILENTVDFLTKQNKPIDTMTLDTYNYYKTLRNGE